MTGWVSGGSAINNTVKVFATTGTDGVATAVFRELKTRIEQADGFKAEMGKVTVSRFSNENIEVQVDNVRDHTVIVLHTQTPPVNDNLIQLFALLDAINNSHPRATYVVFPYMPYSRSDRKNRPRISVMGQRLPEILNTVLGVRRVMIIEPHSQHLKQYFTPTADEVPAVPLLVNEIRRNHLSKWKKDECTLVFADAGAAKRFEEVPSVLGLEQAYIHKMRQDNTESPAVKGITGNVKGRHCLILDDEILTGNTLIKDAELLRQHGAASIHMFAVHGILADRKCSQADLMKRLFDSPVDEIVVTDTVPIGNKAAIAGDKLRVIPIAPLLGEACKRIIMGESLSELHRFDVIEDL